MAAIELARIRCYRCYYEWIARKLPVRACPRCRSKLYATPRLPPVRIGKGLGIREIVSPKRTRLLALARKHGAKRVRIFGSVRRQEADRSSDIDLLVEWRETASPLAPLRLAIDATELFGRRVDVVSDETLPWSLAPRVLSEAVEI